MWPHKMVYMDEEYPAVYDNMSISLCVSRYMHAMEAEKPAIIRTFMANHLVELMGDAKLYSWEPVHVFHAKWLHSLSIATSHVLRMQR